MLRNAVRAHGRRWIELVERYFPNRTPIATRNRYNHLCHRDNDERGIHSAVIDAFP